MKLIPSALARIALSLFLLAGSAAKADNELIVYVFSNGAPVAGVDVTVDGDVIGSTQSDGSVTGDLSSGGHAISVESSSKQALFASLQIRASWQMSSSTLRRATHSLTSTVLPSRRQIAVTPSPGHWRFVWCGTECLRQV